MTTAPSRLKRRREFVRASAVGRKAATAGLVLQAVARDDGGAELRCGFTVSRRVGNAVVRNRARRRLKAAAGEIMPGHAAPAFDYVLIGRAGTVDRPYDALCRDLVAALKRLKLWRDGERAEPVRERS
jgi:ribonuclease P protein component